MSGQEAAHRLLRQLRAAADQDNPRRRITATELWQGLTLSELEELRADPERLAMQAEVFARAVGDPDAAMDRPLMRVLEDVEHVARGRISGGGLDELRPVIGSLRTGQVNATSLRTPGDRPGYLVLVEDQLMYVTSAIGELMAMAVPWRKPMFRRRARIRDPALSDFFTEIITRYAVTGSPAGGRTRLPDLSERDDYRAFHLAEAVDHFIVAHEYMHVVGGHLDEADTRRSILPGPEAQEYEYSWRLELEADLAGMFLAFTAGVERTRRDQASTFWGIALFFDLLDVMDRAVALLRTGDEQSRQIGSHPPSRLRKYRLIAVLGEMADRTPQAKAWIKPALDIAALQEEVITVLWEHTRPVLLSMHADGARPAPTWRDIAKEQDDGSL